MRDKWGSAVVFEAFDPTQEQFDQPIFWVLAALLAFMPAAKGSWDAWAEAIALALACAAAVLLGIKLIRRRDVPFVWSWTYLPIALFYLLAAIQLLPLPAAVIGAISPKTLTTSQTLLGDLPGAAKRLEHLRLNFYQEGGWHDLRNLVAVTCVFIVVINVFRRSEQMIQLLWVIAWVGSAQALLAILQIATDAHGVYWVLPQWGNARPDGGTFPNHNCFAQFMNLSIGAMAGLLLLKLDQTFKRHDYTSAEVMEKLTSTEFRWAWALIGMIALSIASIFLSLSRGGMLSTAIAGVVVGILIAVRGGSRGMGIGGWVVGVILVAVFSLVMAGGANLVESRIAKIGNPDDRFDRFELTRDTIRAWKDYPALGMGLGSFRFAFQAYDRSHAGAVASHAEDEYAELLQETGIAGGAIAASFLLLIFANFLRARARGKANHEQSAGDSQAQAMQQSYPTKASRHGQRKRSKNVASPASSLALGLAFGLIAILVQSGVDFGQHCVSIACLTAISCGLLVSLARLRRRERGIEQDVIAVRGWLPLRAGSLVLFVIVAALLLWQANDAQLAAAAYWKESKLADTLLSANWQGDRGEFIDMNRAADEAARLRPNDMRYRYWRAMNRWYTISDVHDPASGDVILDADKKKILADVADDLREARWSCPLYGPPYAQLGQWEQNFFGQPVQGARDIHRAFDLAPGDATVCFILATQEVEEGAWADSVKHYQLAVSLDDAMLRDVIDLYVSYFHRPELALQFAGDDVDRLRRVAKMIRALGKDPALPPTTAPATLPSDEAVARAADKRAEDLIRASADRPDASAKTLGYMGMLCAQNNDPQGAVNYLGRALAYNFGNIDWRLEYARDLARLGRREDAIRQADIVLLARPHMPEAETLAQKLSYSSTRAIDEMLK